jgi:hypothetical protein
MKDIARYRAMESLCRQSAVFNPLESWRLLAQAEMWHHKAWELESRAQETGTPPAAILAESASRARQRGDLLAG